MGRFFLLLSLGWFSFALPVGASESYRYIPDRSGLPQGGIILRYPDVVETTADRMSKVLSQHGWSVLLVPIIDTSDPIQEPVETNQLVDYMTGTKGQYNLVVLVIGDTWDQQLNVAIPESEDDPQNPIQGLILVDVIGDVIAPKELPLLDIMTESRAETSFKRRRNTARRNQLQKQRGINLKHYSTRALQNGENILDRRIRGWLRHHVKGMELSSIAR